MPVGALAAIPVEAFAATPVVGLATQVTALASAAVIRQVASQVQTSAAWLLLPIYRSLALESPEREQQSQLTLGHLLHSIEIEWHL